MKCIIQKNQEHKINFFLNFYWFSEFHIVNLDPTYLPPCFLVSISAHGTPPPLPPKKKQNAKENYPPSQQREESCHGISNVALWITHCTLLPFIFTNNGLVQGLRLLVPYINHDSLWGFSWLYCCLVSWRSCSFGSVGLSSSHAPAVDRYSWSWGELILSLGLGLGGSWVPHPLSSGNLSSTVSANSFSAAYRKELGQFSCSLVPGCYVPKLTPSGLLLLSGPGEVEDPLSQLLQGAWKRDTGSVLLLPHTLLAHLHHNNRISSKCAALQGAGPLFCVL